MRLSDGAERSLAVKDVEHDALEQVAQGHIVIFRQGLENLEEALLHADAGLDALDHELRFGSHSINVPWYMDTRQLPRRGDAASAATAKGQSLP